MMRNLLSLLVFFSFFFACQKAEQGKRLYRKGEKEVIVYGYLNCEKPLLWSPIAKVSLSLPEKYDAFYNWIYSHCTVCDSKPMYRFAQKKNCHYQEHAFNGELGCRDSIDNVTISLNRLIFRSEHANIGKSTKIKVNSQSVRFYISEYESGFVRMDNDKLNAVVISTSTMNAVIYKDSIALNVDFECRGVDCEGFQERACEILESINIERLL